MSESRYQVLERLRVFVLDALHDGGSDPVTMSYVNVGLVIVDVVDGLLVVTPGRTFRYRSFPIEDTAEERCASDQIAMNVTVSLARQVPEAKGPMSPPSDTAIDEAHARILEDADLIWNALAGPLPDELWERAGLAQEFVGAEGGGVSVETSFVLGLPARDWTIGA